MCKYLTSKNSNQRHVVLYHSTHKSIERYVSPPTKFGLCLPWISDQNINLCRSIVHFICLNEQSPRRFIIPSFGFAICLPRESHTYHLERLFDEFSDGVRFSGGKDKVISNVCLQHSPHSFNVIFCMTPVPLCVQVPYFQHKCLVRHRLHHAYADFPRHEFMTTSFGFVIEKYTIARKHTVTFSIVFNNPERIQLCYSVGTSRIKWGCLRLGYLLNLSI